MDNNKTIDSANVPRSTGVKYIEEKIMLTFGSNCKKADQALQTISLEELYQFIVESPQGLIEFCNTLRSVLRYSKDRYRNLKTNLPFFCASHFDPPFRKMQNFVRSVGLIIDIDQNQKVEDEQINKLKQDSRIALGYISPSGTGIKLLILFDEPVENIDTYSMVYKRFSGEFAAQYHLMDKLDQKNSDVSRISFLCNDEGAWMRSDYTPVIWRDYIDAYVEPLMLGPTENKNENKISEHTYQLILEKLGSRPRPTRNIIPMMPEIECVMDEISKALATYQINVDAIEAIQYGAKLILSADKDKAEINIYHGKKGYSTVVTAKRNTNVKLGQVAKHIVESTLYGIPIIRK